MIKDGFNRVHDYLRISLTDNCNLRCFYCMPEEDYDFTPASRLMQPDEILTIAKQFVDMGVNKIRLTGGEPLVRKDVGKIIQDLATLPVRLTLTTNGTRLHQFADLLKDAGVTSLNISLDTLDQDRFLLLTRRNQFYQVMENIQLMVQKGFTVKVNMVVMKGINHEEILNFVAWTKNQPVHVRFIEFMPFSGNHWKEDKVFTWQQMMEQISLQYDLTPIEKANHDTARQYKIMGHAGSIAVIATMSAPFCSDCNRMRLTADGKMKNCLFSRTETDLLTPFRQGEDIAPLILASIAEKKKALGGQFTDLEHVDAEQIINRSMITIGG
ncbi:MAG: GTP 3',8-cyclase MoaA [Chitinophagaceae bacterium]